MVNGIGEIITNLNSQALEEKTKVKRAVGTEAWHRHP